MGIQKLMATTAVSVLLFSRFSKRNFSLNVSFEKIELLILKYAIIFSLNKNYQPNLSNDNNCPFLQKQKQRSLEAAITKEKAFQKRK